MDFKMAAIGHSLLKLSIVVMRTKTEFYSRVFSFGLHNLKNVFYQTVFQQFLFL